jgi:hypothetical protein
VSLNLITLRSPNQITLSDACDFGLGGFSCNSGRAWRFHIPPELQHKRQINFLEYLACIIAQLLEIYENRARPGDCFLGRGDNTSSMGWLESSNFDPSDQAAHAGLARYYAGTMIANEVCSYSEWQAGKLNTPADDLSRLFELNDEQLTHHILSEHGQQVPKNFHISPLPVEIECAIYFWLQTDQLPTPFNPELTPMQIGLGLDGYTSSPSSASPMTPSSVDGRKWLDDISLRHSLRQSGTAITPNPEKRMLDLYAQIPVRAPSSMWLRHLPMKAYQIPSSTHSPTGHTPTSPESSEGTATPTRESNTN